MAPEADTGTARPHLYLVPPLNFVPPVVTDVYPVLGGGWRASCECGETCSAGTPSEGWDWVLGHPCARSARD